MKISSKHLLGALALSFAFAGPASASFIEIGDGSNAQYDCDIAIGDGAVSAGGHGASAPIPYYCAVAIGRESRALGSNTTAIGEDAQALRAYATATGASSRASDFNTTVNGASAQANAINASAFGSFAIANHANSVALGASTATTRENEVAVGNRQIGQLLDGTAQDDAVTLRQLEAAIDTITIEAGESPYFKANGFNDGSDNAFATGPASTSAGPNANAAGTGDVAVGNFAYADSNSTDPNCTFNGQPVGGAVAIGNGASAQGCGAHATGAGANSTGTNASATGTNARANGNYATSGGAGANANGEVASAYGAVASANGRAASAFGNNAQAQGDYATALGAATQAIDLATAIGVGANASFVNSVALGAQTQTTKANQVAVGNRQVSQVLDGTDDLDAVNVRQVAPMANALGGGASFAGGVFTPPSYVFLSGAIYNDVGTALADLDARVWDLEQDGGGTTGPQGPQGPVGADGRSAYEVAVEDGFVGTEHEWLESLQGADGRDGVGGSQVKPGRNIEVSTNEDGTQTVDVADNIELSDQGSVKVGATTVDAEGVKIEGGPSMTTNGIDAGSKRVLNVAQGRIARDSTDAVNGSQLWQMEDRWDNRYNNLDKRVSGICAMGAAQTQAASAGAANSANRKMTAGFGYCGGQAALSAGYSQNLTTKSGSIASWSIGVSSTGDDTSVGVGWSMGF